MRILRTFMSGLSFFNSQAKPPVVSSTFSSSLFSRSFHASTALQAKPFTLYPPKCIQDQQGYSVRAALSTINEMVFPCAVSEKDLVTYLDALLMKVKKVVLEQDMVNKDGEHENRMKKSEHDLYVNQINKVVALVEDAKAGKAKNFIAEVQKLVSHTNPAEVSEPTSTPSVRL